MTTSGGSAQRQPGGRGMGWCCCVWSCRTAWHVCASSFMGIYDMHQNPSRHEAHNRSFQGILRGVVHHDAHTCQQRLVSYFRLLILPNLGARYSCCYAACGLGQGWGTGSKLTTKSTLPFKERRLGPKPVSEYMYMRMIFTPTQLHDKQIFKSI